MVILSILLVTLPSLILNAETNNVDIETFLLERNQTLYENEVEFNLTESGVHPYTVRELLEPEELERLLNTPLGYGYTDGLPGLRNVIASWYPGADGGNVAITHGTSEANLISVLSLLSPGDELIFVVPNFMQISGIARAMGITVRHVGLREDDDWQPDPDLLAGAITSRTRMIALVNPNNPTGQVLTPQSIDSILELAEHEDIFLLSDEIYRGAEIDVAETPSLYNSGGRVIVTSSLSKAFALPGLRLGWLVASNDVVEEAMCRQDYTSIGTSIISQTIAEKVLQPEMRERVLSRTRRILRENVEVLEDWLEQHSAFFSYRRPQAGGIAFVRYRMDIGSTELSRQIREEEGVFIVAGDWFGLDGHLRFGIGGDKDQLREALARISRFAHRHFH